ncbi:sensor histidine kinase [Bowmanella dokdonensis]|uniref:histidine kinase n=1 Tax=Bowmanella dokdonensis TaxID=751969 RepID=A0A939IQ91_9ALTE|nr:HAMP domain-containing sensor histidine kinase [Bowmanella dokdonensis]MBN7824221.1 HAMP domain-containing histidine kinase [Bowmanella dokdonensis]
MKKASLKIRLLTSITLVTCLTALLFGLVSFLFAYHIEDSFFERLLDDEVQRLSQHQSSAPTLPLFSLYQHRSQLPGGILAVLNEEPQRREIGLADGRHYHIKHLPDGRVLLAEVSDYLVVRKIKGNMLELMLFFLAILLSLSLWVALSNANRLLRPLSSLTRSLETLPDTPLQPGFSTPYPNNEIGLLARTLDQQMQRIQAFIQREQQFTRDISHELRTPLTVFSGALTLLKRTELTDKQQELLLRLQTGQQQMQQCLHTLLALAREENLQREALSLSAKVEQALLRHLPQLSSQDREVTLDIQTGTRVWLPHSVLGILLDNLIGNAVVHGDGRINIAFSENCLQISNQGRIDPNLHETLFESGSKGQESQGLGMGLSIVRRLCEAYDIGLSWRSDQEDIRISLDLSRVLGTGQGPQQAVSP